MTPHFAIRSLTLSISLAIATGLTACNQSGSPQDKLELAQAAMLKGDHASAEIHTKQVLQGQPDDAKARLLLAKVSLMQARFVSAEQEAQRALSLGVTDDDAWETLFEALTQRGQLQALKKETDRALAIPTLSAKSQSLAWLYSAKILIAQANNSDARKALEQSLKLVPQNSAAKAGLLGLDIAGTSKTVSFVELKTTLEKLKAAFPASFETAVLEANVAQMSGRNEESRTALLKALEAKPYDLEQRSNLVKINIALKDYASAETQIQALRKLAPSSAFISYLAALSAYGQGNLPKAREFSLDVVEHLPKFIPGLELAAELAMRAGEFQLAEKYGKLIVEIAPTAKTGAAILANNYLSAKAPEKALDILKPWLAQKPAAGALLTLAGRAHAMLGNRARALQLFEAAAVNSAANSNSNLMAANARLQLAGFQDAQSAIDKFASQAQLHPDQRLAVARTFLSANQLDKALEAVNASIAERASTDKTAAGHLTLGSIQLAKGQLSAARTAFEEALKRDPSAYPALQALVSIDLAEGKAAEAKSRHADFLKNNPQHVEASLSQVSLAARAGASSEEVLSQLNKVKEAHPNSPLPSLALSRFYVSQGKVSNAIQLLEPLTQKGKSDERVLDTLTALFQMNGEPFKAIAMLDNEVKQQPSSSALHLKSGELRLVAGDVKGAMTSFKQAQTLAPESVQAAMAVVRAQFQLGSRSEALLGARALLTKFDKDPSVALLLGNLLSAEKKFPEALTAYRDAFARSKNPLTAFRLYNALDAVNDTAGAAKHLSDWWKLSQPKDSDTMVGASDLLIAKKKYENAAAILKQVLEHAPTHVGALNNMAVAAHHLKDPKALSYAELAAKQMPSNFAVLDTLGWLMVEQGDAKGGLKHLQQAAAQAPKNAEVRLHLAQAFSKLGDASSARTEAALAEKLAGNEEVRALAAQLMK